VPEGIGEGDGEGEGEGLGEGETETEGVGVGSLFEGDSPQPASTIKTASGKATKRRRKNN
jgi:hypothetical protein